MGMVIFCLCDTVWQWWWIVKTNNMALLGKYSSLKSTKFCEAAAQTRNTCTIQSLLYKIKPISSVHQEHTHTHIWHMCVATHKHTLSIHSLFSLSLSRKAPLRRAFLLRHTHDSVATSVWCAMACVCWCVLQTWYRICQPCSCCWWL